MTKCDKCGGRGWIEGYYRSGNAYKPTIEQCYKRCNLSGYSDEAQRRLNAPAQEVVVPAESKTPAQPLQGHILTAGASVLKRAPGKVLEFRKRESRQ